VLCSSFFTVAYHASIWIIPETWVPRAPRWGMYSTGLSRGITVLAHDLISIHSATLCTFVIPMVFLTIWISIRLNLQAHNKKLHKFCWDK
jgi:hypothetical protein